MQRYYLKKQAVKELCKKKGIKLKQLANKISLTPDYVSKMMAGRYPASDKVVDAFMFTLALDLDDYFFLKDINTES